MVYSSCVFIETPCIYAGEQVQVGNETRRTYALKQMKKHHIVETHQQEHVLNEKWCMVDARSDFIIRYTYCIHTLLIDTDICMIPQIRRLSGRRCYALFM